MTDKNTLKINIYDQGEEIITDLDFKNDDMFISQSNYFLNSFSKDDVKQQLDASKNSLLIVDIAKQSMVSHSNIKV